jgi:hypothetical protein
MWRVGPCYGVMTTGEQFRSAVSNGTVRALYLWYTGLRIELIIERHRERSNLRPTFRRMEDVILARLNLMAVPGTPSAVF